MFHRGGQAALGEPPALLVLGVVQEVERRDVASGDFRQRRLAVDPTALVVPKQPHLHEPGPAELMFELVAGREASSIDRLEAREIAVQPEVREVGGVERDYARAPAGREQRSEERRVGKGW